MFRLLLWIALPFQEYGEVCARYAFNLRTQRLNGRSRPNQRCCTIPLRLHHYLRSGPRNAAPTALDLKDQRSDLRCEPEHLKIPFTEATAGIERRFQHALRGGIGTRHVERD